MPERPPRYVESVGRTLAAEMERDEDVVVMGVDVGAGIDWQAESEGGWEVKLSPYDTGKAAKGASNIAPFEADLLAKYSAAEQGGEFDRMGRELLGKDK